VQHLLKAEVADRRRLLDRAELDFVSAANGAALALLEPGLKGPGVSGELQATPSVCEQRAGLLGPSTHRLTDSLALSSQKCFSPATFESLPSFVSSLS